MSILERALQKTKETAKSAVGAVPAVVPAPAPPDDDTVASLHERDLKPIVHVDFERLRELGRMPPVSAQLRFDEELRRVKWPLLKILAGRDATAPLRNNVVLLTSAMPSEGKSFVALNLALSIARSGDMRVILVDGDVARPSLTPALGLEDRDGLTDILADSNKGVRDVLYRTDVDGLLFVPAGKWHDNSPELFAGTRMQQLITNLGQRTPNGVVILDSPPLLATNEAQAVARFVGQALLVVRADYTEQRLVQDALALVDQSTPVCAVLNRVEPSLISKYYGHDYHGYGSSHGYAYGRQRPPEVSDP